MTKSKKNKNKGKLPLARFKQSLTVVGRNLSKSLLIRVRGAVNYLWVGRWMADRGFVFPEQVSVSDRTEVFVSIARRVADKKVLYLEFGVAAGESIRWWSSALKNPGSKLHGFDSFEGLPEATWFWTKGEFSTGGKAPKIDDPRISFYVGLFDQTLPAVPTAAARSTRGQSRRRSLLIDDFCFANAPSPPEIGDLRLL